MLKTIAEINLKSLVRKKRLTQQSHFLSWNNINQVALIVGSEHNIKKQEIDNFIKKSSKHIEVFYIEISSKTPTYSDWQCFTKKDTSLLRLPKNKNNLELKSKVFDVVINLCDESNLFAAGLSTSLNSAFVCSGNDSFNTSDLIVVKAKPFDLMSYLNSVVHYLQMIRQ